MKRFTIGSKYEYCPNGNYWQEVSGVFDKRIYLFCDCNKCRGAVYVLKEFNVTKKIGREKIEEVRRWNRLDEIRKKVTLENMDTVEAGITSTPSEGNEE